jgi:hypothetical protein
MKTIFNNSELCHAFATGQTHGRNSNGSMYIENYPNGAAIFSYGNHFCMAAYHDYETILVNCRTYSNTTARQITYLSRAINHKNLFYCPYPLGTYQDNFDWWQREAKNIAAKFERAIKLENYVFELRKLQTTCEAYAELKRTQLPQSLADIFSVLQSEKVVNYMAALPEKQKKAEQKKERQRRVKFITQARKFLTFEISRINEGGNDYLRINKADKLIETTQAVKIPFTAARLFYERLRAEQVKQGDTIEQYQVIKCNGVVKIGCHNFTRKHLLKIGNQLNQLINQ